MKRLPTPLILLVALTHCELFSKLSNTGLKLSRIAHYVDQTMLETRVSASIGSSNLYRLLKNSVWRLLKKISEARRVAEIAYG